jgi:hypothetical protein
MPRMWAQDWQTNSGRATFSLHRNRDDVTIFGIRHNKANEQSDKLNAVGSPRQVNADIGIYNYICDSAYGRVVNWRP